MIKTLPLDELEKYSDNIYELIIALAKRARQINAQRQANKVKLEEPPSEGEVEAELLESYEFPEVRTVEKYPKPTMQALKELLGGKLKIKYPEEKFDTLES